MTFYLGSQLELAVLFFFVRIWLSLYFFDITQIFLFNLFGTQFHLSKFCIKIFDITGTFELGNIWRFELFILHFVPVDVFEPWVPHYFFYAAIRPQSLQWILFKQFRTKIFSIIGYERITQVWLRILDHLIKSSFRLVHKRRQTSQHFENDTTEAPEISCLAKALTLQHFRGHIFSCTTNQMTSRFQIWLFLVWI